MNDRESVSEEEDVEEETKKRSHIEIEYETELSTTNNKLKATS